MQCQVKTLYFLALLIISFCSSGVQAEEVNWESFSSPKMEIEAHSSAQGEVISSYIPFFQEIGHMLWSWDPAKELKKTSESVLIEPSMSGLNELMKNLFVEFDVSNTQNFRKVWFKPTSDLKFRGLLGLHDLNKKRPLIILRMGVHGNVDEIIAERFLAKIIFEDLGANFLMIESLTSHAYLSKNKNISFGGVDEGLQTFLALNEINKSKLNSLIDGVHLLSISMGSHGTFVTAMLDQHNEQKIKSIVNFCPLINLQPTVERGLEINLKNALISLWNVRRLRAVFEKYQNDEKLGEWWKTIFDFKPRFTSALLEILNRDRKQPLISPSELEELIPKMKWPKGFREHLENSQSFYQLNNFWPYYQGVKTPIMIYTTPKDPLVINKLNSELIFRGQQPGDFTSLKYHRLENAVHCGLPAVYKWDYIVKLVRDGLVL
ncbi:MAG: hypothetical protein AABY53_08705 [Bdellovibrionota bacterium]